MVKGDGTGRRVMGARPQAEQGKECEALGLFKQRLARFSSLVG